jgi:hypothetical protein
MCLTHYRHVILGEFGERAKTPWAREQARDVLINQDGLDPETAEKKLNKHFGEPKAEVTSTKENDHASDGKQ